MTTTTALRREYETAIEARNLAIQRINAARDRIIAYISWKFLSELTHNPQEAYEHSLHTPIHQQLINITGEQQQCRYHFLRAILEQHRLPETGIIREQHDSGEQHIFLPPLPAPYTIEAQAATITELSGLMHASFSFYASSGYSDNPNLYTQIHHPDFNGDTLDVSTARGFYIIPHTDRHDIEDISHVLLVDGQHSAIFVADTLLPDIRHAPIFVGTLINALNYIRQQIHATNT